MKKVLGILLVTAYLSAPLTTPVFASAKAGTACSKAGLTSMVSGMKYTCVKSGKKLVWNKGTAIPKTTTLPATKSSPTESKTPTPTPTPTYKSVEVTTKTAKIGNDLEISYISPINWGGKIANANAIMDFPVTLKSNVDANIIRVLIQHSEGVQNIVISGKWDWLYVKAGETKVMDLSVPLSYLKGERDKGYTGGYTFKVFLNYKESNKPEARFEIPIDFVLPTIG